jgi:DNA excision repair protein ERCC-4
MPHSFHAPQTLTLFLSRSLCALFARRYYATPTLLIEFDDSRGNTDFTLMTDDKDLMSEPSNESIITKLAVLTMKFNKARYLWSRNPKETVEIFKAVKELDTSHVDPKTAVEFGGSDEIDKMLGIAGDDDGKGAGGEEDEDGVNSTAVSILLKLPGVDAGNVKKIMVACDNLAELSELSKEDLKPLIGIANANRLWSFFRVKMNDATKAVAAKGGKKRR